MGNQDSPGDGGFQATHPKQLPVIFTMDAIEEGEVNCEMSSQPPSEKIQHAMQELINSGSVQISTSQSNFIDSCNELLHLPFYSEEGTVRIIQSLAKLNGNFVTKIIRKGLSGLKKVYTSKTFEDESIQLVEFCVSLYLKQRNKEDGYHFTPSPAIVVDCAVELCDELVKSGSGRVSTQPQILLSRCLMDLAKIYEAIESGKLIFDAELDTVNPNNATSNPIDTFRHIFNALKSRINDDLFEELLLETLVIATRDRKLDSVLNPSRLSSNISAKLLHAWKILLQFPFVTSWFAVQTAKKDVLLPEEGYAQRLTFGHPMAYSESLIFKVFSALKTLNSQGNYKLSGEKKRLQVFFDHPEIFLRHSTLCLQLLESNVATQCIQEVFETLAIKLNSSALPQMTDAQLLECHNSPREHQKVVNTILQAMLRLNNQEPILKILSFWKETFNDDNEYVTLANICILMQTILRIEHREVTMETFAEFLTQLRIDLHSPLQMSVIRKFLKSLQNIPMATFIQEGIKKKSLELALSLFEKAVPLTEEYESLVYAAVNVVSDMETDNAEKYLHDFLYALVDKSLDQDHCLMAQSILTTIEQCYCTTEKLELFQSFLRLFQTSTKTKIINALEVSKGFMDLRTNAANTVKFFDFLIKRDDLSNCHQIVWCSSLFKNHYKEGLHEFISFMFTAFDKTLSRSSRDDCDLFIKQATINLLLASTSIDAETYQHILACIAGSIAAGSFDETVSNLTLKSICIYLKKDNNQSEVQPFDILTALYKELIKVFHQIKSIAPQSEAYTNNFVCGITDIFRLPLPLLEKINLIARVTEILRQGKFNTAGQVYLIMAHLFKTEGNASFVEPGDLLKHFKEVMNVPVAEKLAKIFINTKVTRNKEGDIVSFCGPSITLIQLLTEKTPLAFEQGTSSDLFEFVINRIEKRNIVFATSILAMANANIKKNVTPKEFKKEFINIDKFFNSIPSFLIQLVSECHSAGLTGKRKIRSLIKLLGDSFTGPEDNFLHKVNNSLVSFLNIQRQLVLVLQETFDAEKSKIEIKRVLDVIRQLDPLVLYGGVSTKDGESFEIFQTLAPHDFHVLMRHTLLKPQDVCTVLNAYTVSDELPFHKSQFTMDKAANLDADTNWSEDYDPSKALTPGKVTYLIFQHLRRLNVKNNDVQTETLSIFKQLLRNYCFRCIGCPPQRTTFQEYMAVFACIMKGSSSLNEIKKWLDCKYLNGHHVVVCKEIILEVYSGEGRKREQDESLRISQQIMKVFTDMSSIAPLCMLNEPLHCMANILRIIQDEETVYMLFEFLFEFIAVRSTAYCVDVIAGWNKTESLAFLAKLRVKHKESASPVDIERSRLKLEFWLPLLPFVSKAFPNSAKKVGNFLDKMIDRHELDDPLSLGRIPVWFKQMTDAGYSQQIIDSWCTSLILYGKLTSSDVDAITNLTPSTIQEITNEPGEIEECLFKANAPKTWRDEDSNSSASKKIIESFKRCLKFAKILNEFASIAKQFKENSKKLEKIKEGTHALCSSFIKSMSSSDGSGHGGLYKDLDNVPKELFVLLFSGEDGTSEESLSLLTPYCELSECLAIAFRRLARSVHTRPILFANIKSIVDKMLQHFLESLNEDFQKVQNFIHKQILDLEPNQDAMHSLQAARYNQSSPKEDLWYSSSIQVSSNVPHVSSVQQFRMQRVLIQMWREWRSILLDLNIQEVEVNGEKIKTTDLMNYSDSLETMESQLEALKKATQDITLNDWSSLRCVELIQQEKNLRHKIKEQEMQTIATAGKSKSGSKMAKLVIIWNNQFLESVTTCSEKIPGCYAPNGFHSEKPVICGLSVDNRIITLFKEEKGNTFTELEDVEVKLFPVGMLVFSVYSSCFSYDTDQLWAAFFKELLIKRLVPKIFLTNVSPGFEWIKRFVKPEETSPKNVTFCRCNSLIPTREDSFDYEPNFELLRLHTATADHQMKELIILTQENVRDVDFQNLQSPNRDIVIRERMERVGGAIRNDSRLQTMLPASRKTMLNRLGFATRKAVEITVDGGQPTEENISSFIDLTKLSSRCEDSQRIQENGQAFYCRIILDAIQAEVRGSTDESNKAYECVVNMPNS